MQPMGLELEEAMVIGIKHDSLFLKAPRSIGFLNRKDAYLVNLLTSNRIWEKFRYHRILTSDNRTNKQ